MGTPQITAFGLGMKLAHIISTSTILPGLVQRMICNAIENTWLATISCMV